MSSFGISCGVHYKSNNKFTSYVKYNNSDLDFLDSIDKKIVSLPMHLNLSDEDINYIIESANKFNL